MTRRYFDDDTPVRRRRDRRSIDDRLLDAVREWDALRERARKLKILRVNVGIFGCDRRGGAPGCWRILVERGDDAEATFMPLERRCPACQRSYRIHLDAVATSKQAGVALRRLRALLRNERNALRDPTGLQKAS